MKSLWIRLLISLVAGGAISELIKMYTAPRDVHVHWLALAAIVLLILTLTRHFIRFIKSRKSTK